MKKNIRNRIIGTVLAAVCAFSAAAAVTTVGASAATVDTAASVSASKTASAAAWISGDGTGPTAQTATTP